MDSDLFDPEEFEASAASQNTIDDYSLHGAAQYDELKQGAKMVRDVISGDFNSGAGKQTETGVSSLIINRPPVVATVVKLLASETALSLPQTPKVRADENGRSPKRRKLHRDTSSDSRRKVDEKDGVDSGDEKIGHEPRPTSQSTLRSALPIDAPKPKPSKRNPLYPSWPNENCHTGAGTQEFIKGGIRLRKGFSFKRVSFDKSCSPPTFVNVKKWLIPTEGKLPAPKVIENTEAHTSATLDIFPMTPSSLFEYLQQLYDSPTLQCAPCKSLYDCIPSWQPQSQPSSDFLDTGSTTSFFPNPGSGSDPTVTLAMWLDEWKTAKGCDRDSREQSKQRSIKRHRSDSTGRDFASSDEEYYDSDSDGGGQPTSPEHLMLIGPPGVGKTSLVYAIAGEKDFDIIEINAGQRRNGKDILIAVGEAVNNQNIEQLGKVAEGINIQRMFAAISDAPPPTSKRKGKDAAAKGAGAKRTGRTKARATGKSRKRKSRQQAGAVENSGRNLRSFFTPKNCEGAETESEEPVSLESASEDVDIDVEGLGDTSRGLPPAIDAASDLPSPPSTKGTLRKRLVLLDEVDALCEADRGFWGSVLTLLHKSKCPIIFTCNSNPLTPSNQMIPNGILSGLVNLIRLVQIQWPSTKQVACYLHLKCLASGYWLTDTKPLALIAQAYRGDVRKCLTHLALYTRSLSGEEGKPDAASAESTSETLRGFKVISLGVPFIGGCHRNTVGQLASLPLPQTNGISRMPTKAHLPAGALLELLTPYIKEADALALYDILANSRVKSFNGLLVGLCGVSPGTRQNCVRFAELNFSTQNLK
ncbi:uncharacterized protein EV422DRAFT_418738 [Fimicolochytrium jonesii]|uniref:uncharacterized protein n=1 Tax=Fimicolochytrium jonesii TaxID=1396493 RepID=UPI0022FE5300|nr:uncharacterized protein EV422DRAFT_418738 [Fimicolochytrium jonesii]KAI8822137.1 hypothetical protein EV422DRAFT_418738 [Fimicolochytrium jonesii]